MHISFRANETAQPFGWAVLICQGAVVCEWPQRRCDAATAKTAPRYAAAGTKPSARNDAATPRTPPPPATSTWPWWGEGDQRAMGTETTQAGRQGAPGATRRTSTERPRRRAQAAANAPATTGELNQTVATRPETARDDTRHETNWQPPAEKADQTTEEKEGSDAMAEPPCTNDEAATQRRSTASRPTPRTRRAGTGAPLDGGRQDHRGTTPAPAQRGRADSVAPPLERTPPGAPQIGAALCGVVG